MSNKSTQLQVIHKNLNTLIDNKVDAFPSDFNKTRFMQNCMTVLQDTKGIEKCEPLTVARTLLKGAFLGLDFFQKECYAIPYGNSLQFQTDYKGETKMAKKYSIRPIKDIYAKLVREGDVFEETIHNGKPTVNFEPKPFNNGAILGAFAVVLFEDDGMDYETMSAEEIEGIRNDFSKMKNGLMWTKTPGEAYKKTVIRRLCKRIEKDFGNVDAARSYNEGSDFEFNQEESKQELNQVPDTFNREAETVEVQEVQQDDLSDTPFAMEGDE